MSDRLSDPSVAITFLLSCIICFSIEIDICEQITLLLLISIRWNKSGTVCHTDVNIEGQTTTFWVFLFKLDLKE